MHSQFIIQRLLDKTRQTFYKVTTHTNQLGNDHIDIIWRLLDKTWQTFYRVTAHTNQLGNECIDIIWRLYKTRQTFYRVTTHTRQLGNELLCKSQRIIGNFESYLTDHLLIPPYDTNAFTLITIIKGLLVKTRQTFYRVTTHTNQLGNKLLC